MHRLAASLLFLVSASMPLAAGEIESAYTEIDIEKCRVIAQDRQSGWIAWSCTGYQAIEFYVAEGDIRFFVSAGPDAGRRMAANQTLPQFNTTHNVMEWRLEDGAPFATILRYFVSTGDEGEEEQVLVVSKLGAENSCHVAYVNASRNDHANELARKVADDLARDFVCGVDEAAFVGNQ